MSKLKAKQCEAAKPGEKPYKLADGRGLFLLVMPSGSKFWRWKFRIRVQGTDGKLEWRERQAALGVFCSADRPSEVEMTLAQARDAMEEARQTLREGKDPVAEKHAKTQPAPRSITFRELAKRYVDGREDEWRNPKHRQQWRNTLATYAYPEIGDLGVAEIETSHIEKLLLPIWREKPETASRLRGRIEAVLSYAKTLKLRTGENPAAWRDNLKNTTLGKRRRQVGHHAALPWQEVGDFIERLRTQTSTGAKALEFTILTAARSGEVRGARWGEIDLEEKVWVVPAERMKASREHRVPLSEAALGVLEFMAPLKAGDASLVFPGLGKGKMLSDMTLAAVLKRMKHGEITVHGFRTTFRTWAASSTAYAREVCEATLAHANRDKVEAAYQRDDYLEKRRRLMAEWAEFCGRPSVQEGNVRVLRQA